MTSGYRLGRMAEALLLAVGLALTGLTLLPAPAAHAALGDDAPASVSELGAIPGSLLLGVHMNPGATETHLGLPPGTLTNQNVIESFETTMNRKLDLHRIFLRWDDEVPPTAVDSAGRHHTPVLSFAALRRDDSIVPYAEILAGTHDAEILRQAQQVAALATPVFVTFQHEPDVA